MNDGLDEQKAHANPEQGKVATGTQEDIDLLIAFDEDANTRMILLEAKAESGWTNEQLRSKSERLRVIFGEEGERFSRVIPHFGIISPREPQGLHSALWPGWMIANDRPIWMPLNVPRARRSVYRSDANRSPSAAGTFYSIRPLAEVTTENTLIE